MEYAVKITRKFNEGPIRAIADVTVGDVLTIRAVRVMEGPNGMFVRMPSDKWTSKEGDTRYTEMVVPKNPEIREELLSEILSAISAQTRRQGEALMRKEAPEMEEDLPLSL